MNIEFYNVDFTCFIFIFIFLFTIAYWISNKIKERKKFLNLNGFTIKRKSFELKKKLKKYRYFKVESTIPEKEHNKYIIKIKEELTPEINLSVTTKTTFSYVRKKYISSKYNSKKNLLKKTKNTTTFKIATN